jgi:hypothetical protein
MPKKNSPGCNCCGCVVKSQQLFPDFYTPEVTCFKRVRERITVATLTTQLTRTWVGGVQTNSTATLVNETVVTKDETIDSITEDRQAGRFEWVFPQVEVPFGPQVVQSETGTPGVDGTRTFFPITRTRTNRTVWEEYRLMLKYDVSNQFNFGRDDAASQDIIRAAVVNVSRQTYTLDGWVGATGQANQVTMRGLYPDADEPSNADEFDDLWAAVASSATLTESFVTEVNILTWLPTSSTDSVHLLFFSDTNKRGLIVSDGQIRIWDRPAVTLPAIPYDWTQHWVREDYNQWRTRSFLPTDNYQISLASLLPSSFWATASRRLIVSFFKIVDGEEQVRVEQSFQVEIDPVGFFVPIRWNWYLMSRGSFGTVRHAATTVLSDAFPQSNTTLFNGFGPTFKIRGSVIEMSGLLRNEDGLNAVYQFVPYWIGGSEYYSGVDDLRNCYLRIRIESDNPRQSKYDETGLQHIDDGKKLTCPGNYTCSVIDDYAHPEWRLISHSFTGLEDDRTPTTMTHASCQVSGGTSQRVTQFEINFDYRSRIDGSQGEYLVPVGTEGVLLYLRAPLGRKTDVACVTRAYERRDFSTPVPESVDTSDNSHYDFSVQVFRGYYSLTCVGIPGNTTSLARPVHLNQTVLVASGLGVGLVFTVSGLHSFTPNANVNLSIARFTFAFETQAFVPTLASMPTESDASAISAAIGGASYWFYIDGAFYRIHGGSIHGPFAESGIDTQELVDVVVSYTPHFRRNATTDASSEDVVVTGNVQFTQTTTNETLSAGDVFGSHDYPSSYDHGGRTFTLDEITYGRGTTITSNKYTETSYGGLRPIVLIKRAPRWSDRNMPTLTFTGADAHVPFDYAIGVFRHQRLRKIDQFRIFDLTQSIATFTSTKPGLGPGIGPFGSSEFTVEIDEQEFNAVPSPVMVADVQTLDLNDLSLTIGPSTYVPPAPL